MKTYIALLVNLYHQVVTISVDAASIDDVAKLAKERWIIDTLSNAHDYEVGDVGVPVSTEEDINFYWRSNRWHVVYIHEYAEGKIL